MVTGTQINTSATFKIGSVNFVNHEFVLDDNNTSGSYLINVTHLLEDPNNNIDELNFGVKCLFNNNNDECEVSIDYEVLVYRNGTKQGSSRTKRYGSLMDFEEVQLSENLTKDDNLETVKLLISLTEENKRNDYRNLPRFDIYISINIDIEYN